MSAETQPELMFHSRRIVRRATRWFPCARNRSWSIGEHRLPSGLRRPWGAPLRGDDESEVAEHQPGGRRPWWPNRCWMPCPSGASKHGSSLFSSLIPSADRRGAQDRHTAALPTLYYRLGAKLDLHLCPFEQINHSAGGQPLV